MEARRRPADYLRGRVAAARTPPARDCRLLPGRLFHDERHLACRAESSEFFCWLLIKRRDGLRALLP